MNLKLTPIALAVSALLVAPVVMAQDNGELSEGYAVSVENSGRLSIESTISSQTSQSVTITADIPVTSKAQAVVDDKQLNTGNMVLNYAHDNNAGTADTAGDGASGNIGVNIASGDNNMQDNAAAIAEADAYFVFGAAESQAMTTQISKNNLVLSKGSNNSASVAGGFADASGNIGINVAAGNGNMQKNNLVAATSPSRASLASVQNVQRSKDNLSANSGTVELVVDRVDVTLEGGVSGGYGGTTGGTTTGQSDQIGNVYPDIWSGSEPHPSGTATQIGHVDLDNEAQGAQDLNDDGGALAFNNSGSYSGSETGTATLNGTFSGQVVTTNAILHQSQNNAFLNGNALSGASGNIGVNIASGNGNLQNNSLSMAVARSPVAAPGNGEQPPTNGGESLR